MKVEGDFSFTNSLGNTKLFQKFTLSILMFFLDKGSVDDVKQISVISILSCDTQSAEDEKIVLELPKPSRVKKLEKRIKQ